MPLERPYIPNTILLHTTCPSSPQLSSYHTPSSSYSKHPIPRIPDGRLLYSITMTTILITLRYNHLSECLSVCILLPLFHSPLLPLSFSPFLLSLPLPSPLLFFTSSPSLSLLFHASEKLTTDVVVFTVLGRPIHARGVSQRKYSRYDSSQTSVQNGVRGVASTYHSRHAGSG